MNQSRRDVLKYAAVTAAGALPLAASRNGVARTRSRSGRVRNIIFMVADGMSAGVPSLAEPFSQLVRKHGTHWAQLARTAGTVHGHLDMAALDSLVTDSAAAASAWGSGSRINNGVINMLPDGTELVPLAKLAKDAGRRVGLVTTTRITHATPAGFAAVVPSRGLEDDIAEQYLDIVDVLLGGGSRHFPEDLLERYREAGYEAITQRQAILNVRGFPDRMIGLFTPSHFQYVLDMRSDETLRGRVPTLAEMSRAALTSLSTHRDGFLLQIEGGRVDHAAHGTDAAAIMWEQLDFDDAIGAVLEFMRGRDDTLLVITSDHGNANPGLNGIGGRYRGSTAAFERLANFTASFSTIQREVGAAEVTHDVQQGVQRMTGIEITPDEATLLRDALQGDPVPEINRQLATFRGQLAQILGNHTGVMFTGRTHTADWVMLMAAGFESERFAGLQRNTDMFMHLTELMGIEHRNPVARGQAPGRRGVR